MILLANLKSKFTKWKFRYLLNKYRNKMDRSYLTEKVKRKAYFAKHPTSKTNVFIRGLLAILAICMLQQNSIANELNTDYCAPADANLAASKFLCTSGDIVVAGLSTTNPPPAFCVAGETVNLDLVAELGGSTNGRRYDIGLYFLKSTSDPSIINPIINDANATCSFVAAPLTSPFIDAPINPNGTDSTKGSDFDVVGDVIGQGTGDGQLPLSWTAGFITVACAPNGIGGVSVETFIDYSQTQDSIGTNPYIPDAGSKCGSTVSQVPMGVLGSLVVKKQALTDDGSTFNFTYINTNVPSSSPTPSPASPFGLLHNGSSDPIYVDIGATNGTISVTEAVPAQYLLTGVACVDTLDATNTVTPTVTSTGFSVDITGASPQVTCTVTNVLKPTVEVEKIWVEANVGDTVSITSGGGTNNVLFLPVADTASETDVDSTLYIQTNGDIITLTESFNSGSATNYNINLNCVNATAGGTDVSGVSTTSSSFTVANQDEITCSYTNTQKAVDLRISKTVNDPTPNIGETITFSLLVENLGPATATDVLITDIIPAGFTYVSGSMTGISPAVAGITPDESSPAGTGLTWTIASLAKDASSTLTFKVVMKAP